MKTRRVLVLLIVIVIFVSTALIVYLKTNPVETTLEFVVRDAVSKAWVWDASFRLQGRIIKAYYQSDQGPIPFLFSGLKPGQAELKIVAPGYIPVTVPLVLKRGKNRIEEPIDLVGYEIPGLCRFIVFEKREGNDFLLEIRPVSIEGTAVLNHPCLDLWIGARITVQMKDGLPVKVPVEEGSVRGDELYRGKLDWKFDPSPETIFRYSARIPGSLIKPSGEPYWVIDYLIVVPDPRKVNPDEVQKIMEKAFALPPDAIEGYLEQYEELGVFTPYFFTSWNVRGGI